MGLDELPIGGLLRGLGAGRGQVSRRALRPAPGGGAQWRLAGPTDAPAFGVFASPTWFALKAASEGRLDLVWDDPTGPNARLTVRDNWIPGALRQWELMAEPQGTAPLDQARLLRGLFALAEANGVDEVFCFSNMARWTDPAVADLVGDAGEPFGTYVASLAGGADARRARLHKKHRYQLKQAIKAGVEVRRGVDPETFVTLMTRTYARGGKARPFAPRYLAELLGAADRLPLLVRSAWHEGTCQAIVVVPYDQRRGYYLHGATNDQPTNGSAVLAHVAVMDQLADFGVGEYDLGGARAETDDPRLEGIFRFKRRFGGPFEPCTRFRCRLTDRPRLGQRVLDAWRAR